MGRLVSVSPRLCCQCVSCECLEVNRLNQCLCCSLSEQMCCCSNFPELDAPSPSFGAVVMGRRIAAVEAVLCWSDALFYCRVLLGVRSEKEQREVEGVLRNVWLGLRRYSDQSTGSRRRVERDVVFSNDVLLLTASFSCLAASICSTIMTYWIQSKR